MLQILNLAHNRSEIERRVHAVIDKFAERGLRSLAVAYQVTGDELSEILRILSRHQFDIMFKVEKGFGCCRMFLKGGRKVLEVLGNLWVSCLFLTPLGMTVPRRLEEL